MIIELLWMWGKFESRKFPIIYVSFKHLLKENLLGSILPSDYETVGPRPAFYDHRRKIIRSYISAVL